MESANFWAGKALWDCSPLDDALLECQHILWQNAAEYWAATLSVHRHSRNTVWQMPFLPIVYRKHMYFLRSSASQFLECWVSFTLPWAALQKPQNVRLLIHSLHRWPYCGHLQCSQLQEMVVSTPTSNSNLFCVFLVAKIAALSSRQRFFYLLRTVVFVAVTISL